MMLQTAFSGQRGVDEERSSPLCHMHRRPGYRPGCSAPLYAALAAIVGVITLAASVGG